MCTGLFQQNFKITIVFILWKYYFILDLMVELCNNNNNMGGGKNVEGVVDHGGSAETKN